MTGSLLGKRVWALILGFLLLSLALFVACTGGTGPQGVQGTKGDTGPQGLAGVPGKDAPPTPGAGVKMAITKVEIPADRKPVVTFTLTDDKGVPLKISDLDGYPGFVLSYIKEDPNTKLTEYVAYTVGDVKGAPYTFEGEAKQPALAEVKGRPGYDTLTITPAPVFPAAHPSIKDLGNGTYTYTFTTVLPETYDKNATHTVGAQVTRTAREFVSNAIFNFVPAGGEVKATRQLVATQNCNQCHDPLALHGGTRREVTYCVLCHTAQNVDPESGNTPNFKVMVHKIHRGANLPSVKAGEPYIIVGHRQTVFDFGEIHWPQDIRNCTTCHQKAPNADNYKTAPSRAACGACHDQIDWATGKALFAGPAGTQRDHPGGPQANDQACALCHQPDSGQEFDASIVGAHVIPAASKQLKGVNFTLAGATAKPGEKPQVDFSIKNNAGAAIDPNSMDYLEITYAHPTTDYAHRTTDIVNRIVAPPATFTRAGTLADLGGGTWRYTLKDPIDASWTGSVGIGMGGYRNATIKGNEGKDVVVREGNINPVIYAALDGGKAVARRAVVKRDNCNQCHKDLGNPAGMSIHGGIRRNTEYCILCHNPNQTDEARRPAEKMPPESVHYKYMIHSLHMGHDRAVPTEFIGFAAAETEEIHFPGDQRNCEKCHAAGTQLLPLPDGVLPTTITQKGEVVKVMPPITAACSACHASAPVAAHESTMTSPKGAEACAVCHGVGKDFDVAKVHARP